MKIKNLYEIDKEKIKWDEKEKDDINLFNFNKIKLNKSGN